MGLLGHAFLKAKRIERGYSLRELSERAGLVPSHIKKIEDGECIPRVDILYDLCNGLDISLYEFFEHIGVCLYKPEKRLNLVPKDAADRERIRKISTEGIDGMAVQGFEPRTLRI
ncbi:MAG: helix-turn-helix transcriptional regulator [Nitrospirae bacterium]|nr:helix-turn-helix transcriptional regulator [Nitrospirota bacterium]